ncbi:MAG: hypothetical protein FH758_10500 [Firmicutes bacterium]|nr:hypothetical protein [Bacillota bacterium]
MKTMTIQALSVLEKKSYSILDNLTVDVELTANPYHLPIDSLFGMAARNNPKRSYLFVSKLIGKHIPVKPKTPQLTGYLLASRFAELLGLPVNREIINDIVASISSGENCELEVLPYNLPSKALFVGFAETATGLGHGVFDSFTGDVNFLHTTREPLTGDYDTIYFTEDHCHAPDQKLLISSPQILEDNDSLVLVDDEVTTGNLCLNIIRSIQKKYPQKHYIILSILDWRSEESRKRYQQTAVELGVRISVLSLVSGVFSANGTSPVIKENPALLAGDMPPVEMFCGAMMQTVKVDNASYLKYTGRFGISAEENTVLEKEATLLGNTLSKMREGKKTLCLGSGEFMYIPFLVADKMGHGVSVQTTTRSPVHPLNRENYAVKHAINFADPYNQGVTNFVYNIAPNLYDEVFVFWEKAVKPQQVAPLVIGLKELGIKQIVFVTFC